MKTKILLLSLTLSLFGCKIKCNRAEQSLKVDAQSIVKATAHTSEVSLDWNGTYHGFSLSPTGTRILVTLKLNNDKTFSKENYYLGENYHCITRKGKFTFCKNGQKITLKVRDGKLVYSLGENKLISLSEKKTDESLDLTKMYTLKKVSDDEPDFKGKYVKGLLVFGHEVASFSPINSSKVYWIYDKKGKLYKLYKRISGDNSAPYRPVIAKLMVKHKGQATEGFAEQYDGVLETLKIKSVKPLTYENYTQD